MQHYDDLVPLIDRHEHAEMESYLRGKLGMKSLSIWDGPGSSNFMLLLSLEDRTVYRGRCLSSNTNRIIMSVFAFRPSLTFENLLTGSQVACVQFAAAFSIIAHGCGATEFGYRSLHAAAQVRRRRGRADPSPRPLLPIR